MYGQIVNTNCKQKRYERCQKLTAGLNLQIIISLHWAYCYTWRHLACVLRLYEDKITSHNLLFYVVFRPMSQKSLNFTVAFNCYKQKRKVVGYHFSWPTLYTYHPMDGILWHGCNQFLF